MAGRGEKRNDGKRGSYEVMVAIKGNGVFEATVPSMPGVRVEFTDPSTMLAKVEAAVVEYLKKHGKGDGKGQVVRFEITDKGVVMGVFEFRGDQAGEMDLMQVLKKEGSDGELKPIMFFNEATGRFQDVNPATHDECNWTLDECKFLLSGDFLAVACMAENSKDRALKLLKIIKPPGELPRAVIQPPSPAMAGKPLEMAIINGTFCTCQQGKYYTIDPTQAGKIPTGARVTVARRNPKELHVRFD